MLTIRLQDGCHDGDHRALALHRALVEHPLVAALSGTVAIGIGGPSPWRADDARPRVAVLTGHGALTRVQTAHIARADGIVITDPLQARAAATPHARAAIIAWVGRPFLRGPTPCESETAWRETREHPELAGVLGHPETGDLHGQVAELVVELVVALGN